MPNLGFPFNFKFPYTVFFTRQLRYRILLSIHALSNSIFCRKKRSHLKVIRTTNPNNEVFILRSHGHSSRVEEKQVRRGLDYSDYGTTTLCDESNIFAPKSQNCFIPLSILVSISNVDQFSSTFDGICLKKMYFPPVINYKDDLQTHYFMTLPVE